MTTALKQTPQPPQLFDERRAFDAKLSALDTAQHSSAAAIDAKKSEDEARRLGYNAQADFERDVRETGEILRALYSGDEARYLALTTARNKRHTLKARGLS